MLNNDSKPALTTDLTNAPKNPTTIQADLTADAKAAALKQKRDKQLDQFIDNHGNSLAGKIWRGNTAQQQLKAQQKYIKTGFEALDKALHGNGWPSKALTEIGLSHGGIGELRMLLPALRALQENSLQTNIILVNPPYLPFAPAWEKEGIQIDKLTVVKTNNIQDTLWSMEQSINAACCAAVLGWTGSYNLTTQALRRLQLATEKSQTWNVLLRHTRCLEQSSVAGLRIQLDPNPYSQLTAKILKQPNGWGGQKCDLSLHPHYENWRRIPVELLPHSSTHKQHAKQKPDLINSTKVTLLSSYSALGIVH